MKSDHIQTCNGGRLFGILPDQDAPEHEDLTIRNWRFVQAVSEGICLYCGEPLRRVELQGRAYGTCPRDLYGAYRVESNVG